MRPLLASLLLSLAACPSPSTPDDALPALDCGDALQIEVRTPGGVYAALEDAGDGAELVQGFQGFRYVYLRARLDADPGVPGAAALIQLDGGTPRSQPIGQLAFTADGAGVLSSPQQIFFNDDPLPELVDRGVALGLVLGDRCRDDGHTVLRYDASCVEGPDGVPICDSDVDAGVGP